MEKATTTPSVLTAGSIVSEGFRIGIANYFSFLGAFILWGLTIWVPYINVGTTIALMTLPIAMSEGKAISPLEIFDGKYRQFMGEMFIQWGLKGAGTLVAFYFLVIPALVLNYAWCLSELLLIDKQLNPAEALVESNRRTLGKKWTMFFGQLLLVLCFIGIALVLGVLAGLAKGSSVMVVVIGILYLLFFALTMSVSLGAKAYIYRLLK